MWHQARKQEKKLRCLMVDYKKRAERRRTYYELCVSNCIKKNSYGAKKRWKRVTFVHVELSITASDVSFKSQSFDTSQVMEVLVKI